MRRLISSSFLKARVVRTGMSHNTLRRGRQSYKSCSFVSSLAQLARGQHGGQREE